MLPNTTPEEQLAHFATPTLYEVSDAVQALLPVIAPLFRPIRLVGRAYPVLAGYGDNLTVHRALAEAPAGSVLVVVNGGDLQHGFWGEITMEAALARQVRGLVTDGAVRDTSAIRARQFPIFCAGVAIAGTTKAVPGILNQPVMIGGVVVRPGDYLVGDDDGVVVIQHEQASTIPALAQARVDKENAMIEQIRQGSLTLDLLNLR
jgi:4-hydroxy-4-methyl-2-oxoglutarate aldolase